MEYSKGKLPSQRQCIKIKGDVKELKALVSKQKTLPSRIGSNASLWFPQGPYYKE